MRSHLQGFGRQHEAKSRGHRQGDGNHLVQDTNPLFILKLVQNELHTLRLDAVYGGDQVVRSASAGDSLFGGGVTAG